MTKKIEEYYRVFDTACFTKEIAKEELTGWEHKESIKLVYIVLDSEEIPEGKINLLDNDYPYFSSMPHALDHIIEEMEVLSL